MKKIGLLATALLVSWLLLEAGALGVYWWIHAEFPSRSRLMSRWSSATPSFHLTPPEEAEPSPVVTGKQLHPFLGFAVDTDHPLANEYGFYGPPPRFEESPDRAVVGIFGGSLALGFYASARDQLEQLLESGGALDGREIDLICLAVDGFKQPQSLISLAYLLSLGAHFDLVINLDGFNEIALPFTENLPNGVPAYYPRSWNLHAERGLDLERVRLISRLDAAARRKAWLQRRALGIPCSYSFFCMTLADSVQRRWHNQMVNLELDLQQRSKVMGRTSGLRGPRSSYAREADFFGDAAEGWRRGSLAMAALCRAQAIAYYHFLQPNQYVGGSKSFSEAEQSGAFEEGPSRLRTAVSSGYPRLIAQGQLLRENKINFFDLTQVFAQETRTVYVDTCCHVNELGYQILARVVADRILATNE